MIESVPVPIRSSQRDQVREERLEILRLLEAGTVTTDEAATLLDALDRGSLSSPNSEVPPEGGRDSGKRHRWFPRTTGRRRRRWSAGGDHR